MKRGLVFKKYFQLWLILGIFVCAGCATTKPMNNSEESKEDVQEVISAVAGAVSGKQLTPEEIKNLEQQMRTDKEAQSAIQSITGSMGANAPAVKYCPLTGKRYAPHLTLCPEHNIELKVVGD